MPQLGQKTQAYTGKMISRFICMPSCQVTGFVSLKNQVRIQELVKWDGSHQHRGNNCWHESQKKHSERENRTRRVEGRSLKLDKAIF